MEKRMALKFENLPYFQNSEMMNHNMQRPIIADILFMKNLIGHPPILISAIQAETLIGRTRGARFNDRQRVKGRTRGELLTHNGYQKQSSG
jgi:hypothetical protein